ncbi:hypothetical protein Tco_0302928 [Tanacetum coccineum]
MTDNSTNAQCKQCFHFLSSGSNSTLRNHITHPHCEALKTVPKAGKSSMARDGSVLVYNPDAGFFGSSNLTADPDAVSMIQTASHLSLDAVGNIQTASLEPGLESSSIFIPVSYLVQLGEFNKWKKHLLCYLIGMKPYYIQCIKDGPFKPKIADGLSDKPESQWTQDKRRGVNQDQSLKSIILSCLPDDIMKSVISCEIAKATWTHLVYSFEAKPSETLLQTYTHYKTLLNELANDGVILSKHKINVGFVNSLPEKWLSFSQGLRNANLSQTLDLAGIYGRFVYEDNLIAKRFSQTKKADNAQIKYVFSSIILQEKQGKEEEMTKKSKFYASTKNLTSKPNSESVSRAKEPTIQAFKSQDRAKMKF